MKHACKRLAKGGRQVQSPSLQLVHSNGNTRGNFLEQTKDEVYYRWRHGRKTERYIAKKLGIQREQVEEILREKVSQLDAPPALQLRRAA